MDFDMVSGCAFTDRSLYIADDRGKKVYELSTIGKFIRIFTTGFVFERIAACQDRIYVTKHSGRQNVYVYNTNGKLIRRISVPTNHARVIVGIDGNLYVSTKKQVYTYTPEGRQVGVTTSEKFTCMISWYTNATYQFTIGIVHIDILPTTMFGDINSVLTCCNAFEDKTSSKNSNEFPNCRQCHTLFSETIVSNIETAICAMHSHDHVEVHVC